MTEQHLAGKWEKLYTTPSHAPSRQGPRRLPGATPESTAALLNTLKDNHVKWHIFFNDKGFHNHASHHLLALYHLGASGPNIEAAYGTHTSYQRPALPPTEPITEKNFHEHLGDEKYYKAYVDFFTDKLLAQGAVATIEEFIFSPKANIDPPAPGEPPMQMANRFLAGQLHCLIHVGYGCEFGLLGQLSEGLGMTAIHPPVAAALTPPSILQYVGAATTDLGNSAVSAVTSLIPSLVLNQVHRVVGQSNDAKATKGPHALSIIGRVMRDDYWSYKTIKFPPPIESEEDNSSQRLLHERGDELAELVKEWTVDGTNAEEVESKIEELFWTAVVIFGVGGWAGRKKSKSGKFNGDFFFLHLVTSVLFLPSIVAYLSPTSISILLRTYLLNTVAMYVARGRPPLPLGAFYENVTATPTPPADSLPPKPAAEGTLIGENRTPSPWLAILQSTLQHPDDHLCKLQRSLAHFAELYGATEPGHLKKLGVDLEGAERVDGSLFVRVAGLSMERVGWMREGQDRNSWDFDAFYHDDY
ncbi:hypothetical protein PYCCODRAFT_1414510 [Trametes coccinea BRFM310]|uniref:Oxidoreductase AflY n=1 Tax=Trametes coccinea (strain BRFM310) TaxID=1353009 RepID=A0A1Y2IJK1_TRAC3|nr:hypothetical protein PYCCODRAFT_1414510 [Trametes coccinea BRFM310]